MRTPYKYLAAGLVGFILSFGILAGNQAYNIATMDTMLTSEEYRCERIPQEDLNNFPAGKLRAGWSCGFVLLIVPK